MTTGDHLYITLIAIVFYFMFNIYLFVLFATIHFICDELKIYILMQNAWYFLWKKRLMRYLVNAESGSMYM